MDAATPTTIEPGAAGSSASTSTRTQRNSSPDFPPHPAPEMPTWLIKCLKLVVLHTDEAADELGRMMDDAFERRLRAEAEGVASANLQTSATAKSTIPAKAHVGSGITKPTNLATKKPDIGKIKPVSSKTNMSSVPLPKKLKRSPSPSNIPPTRLPPGSPEYLAPVARSLMDLEQVDGGFAVDVVASGTSGEQLSATGMEDDDDDEAGDLTALLALGGDDSTCFICGKDIGVMPNNGLLKCNECQKLYHQLCHRPPVKDVNPDDPRLVWNCADCERKMKKISEKVELPMMPKVAPSLPKPKSTLPSSLSSVPLNASTSSQLFKRVESKTNTLGAGAGLAKLKMAAGNKTTKTRDEKTDSKRIRLIDPPPPSKKS